MAPDARERVIGSVKVTEDGAQQRRQAGVVVVIIFAMAVCAPSVYPARQLCRHMFMLSAMSLCLSRRRQI